MAGADLTANHNPHPCDGATHPHAFGEWTNPTLTLRLLSTQSSAQTNLHFRKGAFSDSTGESLRVDRLLTSIALRKQTLCAIRLVFDQNRPSIQC